MNPQRRRGTELEDALYAATLAELVEVGYGKLSMEGIATRAHTGKAALYRRWTNKHDLVIAALRNAMPELPVPDTGRTARDNLRALLTTLCDVLARPTPFAYINIVGELVREPEFRAMFAQDIVAPRLRVIQSILRHGVDTGEIAPDTITPLTAKAGPALVMQTVLLTGKPPNRAEIETIIDTMLHCR
jgi:AcrR family transcriptional regulator